jgi:hypothetical protein
MRELCVFFLGCSISTLVFAQTSEVLLEACNNISDSGKRLVCLKAAVNNQSHSNQHSAAETLRKEFGNIKASLEIGMSYRDYQTALLDLAKEIASFKRNATEKEKAGLDYFEEALNTYKDAGTLWIRSIEFYAKRDNSLAYGGGLPINLAGISNFPAKYNLQLVNADLLGFHRGISVDSSRALIWAKANDQAEEGFRVMKNPINLTFTEALEICGNYLSALQDKKALASEDEKLSSSSVLAVKYGALLSCLVNRASKRVVSVLTGEASNEKVRPPDPQKYLKFVTDAKNVLGSSIAEPASAQYKSLSISGITYPILCGQINIKNSSGTYMGFRRFYADNKTTAKIEDPQDNTIFLQMWPAVCEPKLVDIE